MNTIQSLEAFQNTFSTAPVKVDINPPGHDKFECLFKPLSSLDRDEYEASVAGVDGKRNLSNLRARLVSLCLCDEKGKLIASGANAQLLGDLPAVVVGAMFDKVRELNGMDAEADEEAGND